MPNRRKKNVDGNCFAQLVSTYSRFNDAKKMAKSENKTSIEFFMCVFSPFVCVDGRIMFFLLLKQNILSTLIHYRPRSNVNITKMSCNFYVPNSKSWDVMWCVVMWCMAWSCLYLRLSARIAGAVSFMWFVFYRHHSLHGLLHIEIILNERMTGCGIYSV